jgi:hypothetical protein
MTGKTDVITNGRVLIKNGKIQAVAKAKQPWPNNVDTKRAITLHIDGFIYPGLINLNNHASYAMLPLWQPPHKYKNLHQLLTDETALSEIKYPHELLNNADYFDLNDTIRFYSQNKALVSGETTSLGTPDRFEYFGAPYSNKLTLDRIFYLNTPINSALWDEATVELKQKRQNGLIDTWFVNLAEGTNDTARQEFQAFMQQGLLSKHTTLTNSVALTLNDFKKMAAAGAAFVWTPLSNLMLYGSTARVDLALNAGVTVNLATDWSISGSKTLLEELKLAWEVNNLYKKHLKEYRPFSAYDLVSMVTTNPAKTLKRGGQIGQLVTGAVADIVIIDRIHKDPYLALIKATPPDIKLVFSDGVPKYGNIDLLARMHGKRFEPLCSANGYFKKALLSKNQNGKSSIVSLGDAEGELASALRFNHVDMFNRFKIVKTNNMDPDELSAWLQRRFPNDMKRKKLDKLFITDDQRFFEAVSADAGVKINLRNKYYSYLAPALIMLNHPSSGYDFLDFTVGIDGRAAAMIVAHRDGPDGIYGTEDDRYFTEIKQLYQVPYVGPRTVERLQAYAEEWEPKPKNNVLIFVNDPKLSFTTLTEFLEIHRLIAFNILSYRDGPDGMPGTADDDLFDTLDELDKVKLVGSNTIRKIKEFAPPAPMLGFCD